MSMNINEAQFMLGTHTFWVSVALCVLTAISILVTLFHKNK